MANLEDIKIQLRAIPSGFRGTKKTLEQMLKLANRAALNPKIFTLAREIVKDAPSGDEKAEVIAVYNWAKRNVGWTPDIVQVQQSGEVEPIEALIDPVDLIDLNFLGDCDDLSMLIHALCTSIGKEARFKVIKYPWRDEFTHVYNVVKANGKWIPIDVSTAVIERYVPFGWEYPNPADSKIWPPLGEGESVLSISHPDIPEPFGKHLMQLQSNCKFGELE